MSAKAKSTPAAKHKSPRRSKSGKTNPSPPSAVSDHYVIIMAGGRGERFWPVSREKTPKQLIKLLGNRSFLQQTVDRVRPLVPPANILIITNEAQADEVRKQLPELPKDNIVAEPVGPPVNQSWPLTSGMP